MSGFEFYSALNADHDVRNKAVADGAIAYVLNQAVSNRILRLTYGMPIHL